jgi:hypothetical protein
MIILELEFSSLYPGLNEFWEIFMVFPSSCGRFFWIKKGGVTTTHPLVVVGHWSNYIKCIDNMGSTCVYYTYKKNERRIKK